ncbi:MAG: aminotransferase class V-fold PLP-dependent enzyme [Chloroflexota bacterium]|nr:aminotransferase class V-fold PLP-dependent enzyme [Chloroflexota bacterium]
MAVAEVAVDPKVEALRAQLPAVRATGYFNAGTNGPLPLPAQAALVAAAQAECDAGRIVPGIYEGNWVRNARVRALIAELFGADAAEIALTHSTSEGISTALNGLRWQAGDEVVTTTLEHPGLIAPLCLLAHRFGVRLRYADVAHGEGDVAGAIAALLSPRTRVVALSHVMWSSGAIVDLPAVAAAAHRVGALVVVDGAQAGGQVPIDLHASGVDAYAFAGQKWLCGPEGTGALFVRHDRLTDIAPTYLRYAQLDPSGFLLPAAGANRYEIGEFYGPAVLAQEAALLWLRDEVGLDWAYARTAEMGHRCRDGLARLDGVTVTTPRDRMAGLVCFQAAGMTPQDVAAKLYEQDLTIRYVAYPPGPAVARVACAWWHTEEEIDRLVATVGEVVSAAR